eukprot:gene23756-9312_t
MRPQVWKIPKIESAIKGLQALQRDGNAPLGITPLKNSMQDLGLSSLEGMGFFSPLAEKLGESCRMESPGMKPAATASPAASAESKAGAPVVSASAMGKKSRTAALRAQSHPAAAAASKAEAPGAPAAAIGKNSKTDALRAQSHPAAASKAAGAPAAAMGKKSKTAALRERVAASAGMGAAGVAQLAASSRSQASSLPQSDKPLTLLCYAGGGCSMGRHTYVAASAGMGAAGVAQLAASSCSQGSPQRVKPLTLRAKVASFLAETLESLLKQCPLHMPGTGCS